MNRTIRHEFQIESVSPLYSGDSGEAGTFVRNAEGHPIMLGNALGGALRAYLLRTDAPPAFVARYMGGMADTDEDDACEDSLIYISDAAIRLLASTVASSGAEVPRKMGAKMDAAYGVAERNHLYHHEYLPAGTILTFAVECDVGERGTKQALEEDLEKMICTWAHGFHSRRLQLGGKKSNGFGQFRLLSLRRTTYVFDSEEALEHFIFHREDVPGAEVEWETAEWFAWNADREVKFSMQGVFPYGVYQSYSAQLADRENGSGQTAGLTGLQRNPRGIPFIPSTGLKGIVRHEVAGLIRRMAAGAAEDHIAAACDELFGSTGQRGKLVVSDAELYEYSPVRLERYVRNEESDTMETVQGHPVYIKIDRLTGGAYRSALKTQEEIRGRAAIEFSLYTDKGQTGSSSPYVFPLLYVLRNIGGGRIPLGGRTSIGLGQFRSDKVKVEFDGKAVEIDTGPLSSSHMLEWMKTSFQSFERWVRQRENNHEF